MSDATILTPHGRCVLSEKSAIWLYNQIAGEHDLAATRKTLDDALSGFKVEFPSAETSRLCGRLAEVFSGLSPGQLTSPGPSEVQSLFSALCDRRL